MTEEPNYGDLPEDPDDRSSAEFVSWLQCLAEATSEDNLFDILASQRPPASKLARQQIRGRLVKLLAEKLKELDSGAAAARTADAWLHEGEEIGADLQGKRYVAEETVPWETSVVGADVLDEAAELFDDYIYASAAVRDAFVLFAAYTHCQDSFGVSPILNISSPTKRCGKSSAVIVQRRLCHAPLLSLRPSRRTTADPSSCPP